MQRKTPIQRWEDLPAPVITGKFFLPSIGSEGAIPSADEIRKGRFTFFSHHQFNTGFPPNWFADPFEKDARESGDLSNRHWSKISDFGHGDIKCIWELSRFAWVYSLVQAYGVTGDESYSEAFWQLVTDWAGKNPPNKGVHWKCGQEIAIRMLALVTGYFAFENSKKTSAEKKYLVRQMLYAFAKRIEANIGYALSQNNNHGISEATGLFTAGILIGERAWIKKGQDLIERQVRDLVYEDGSFSQHSANYHRVMLHACLWAIAIGRANSIEFSDIFIDKIRLAGKWIVALVDPVSGKMPNLGSNDGALVLPVSQCGYEDYRPTIQAVGAVIDHCYWLSKGKWDDLALWLGAKAGGRKSEARSRKSEAGSQGSEGGRQRPDNLYFPDGGYAVFIRGATKLIFRCPKRFRHRPGQCDLLHVDLWFDGINILRDAGTYSYNCSQPWQDYFKSTAAHNSIQFDDHEQMPKVSRFLYGKWSELSVEKDAANSLVQAGFTDWKGCFHQRRVVTTTAGYQVMDTISGFTSKATLRWRLAPGLDWKLDGNTCIADGILIKISASSGSQTTCLTDGWESLCYQEKQQTPVLETTVKPVCSEIITHIRFT